MHFVFELTEEKKFSIEKNMEKFIYELDSKKSFKSKATNPCTTVFDLRAPLDNGWKRETSFERFSTESEIEGQVCYFFPGSTRKLHSIEQVQRVS